MVVSEEEPCYMLHIGVLSYHVKHFKNLRKKSYSDNTCCACKLKEGSKMKAQNLDKRDSQRVTITKTEV
jgi:hypothetical protein